LVKTPRHFLAAANLIDQIDFLMAKRRMVKYMLKRSQEFVIRRIHRWQPFRCVDRWLLRGRQTEVVAKVRNGFVSHMRCALYSGVAETHDGEMSAS